MSVKSEDTQAEGLLREIVAASQTKDLLGEVVDRIEKAITRARWYLEAKDACEFVEENGCQCRTPAVRVVHGMWCCEPHARRRDDISRAVESALAPN